MLLEIAKEPDPQRQTSLLEQARSGQLTVRTARQEKLAPGTGRSKKTSAFHSIVLAQATVTIQFRQGEGTRAEIVAALEEALAQTRSG